MPRLTRITTRTGDDGSTALGSGDRVGKDDPRVECYGTVDELNAQLGAALASGLPVEVAEPVRRIQNDLFHLGADLCRREGATSERAGPTIEKRHVEGLERLIDAWLERLPPLANFVLPGGTPGASALHVARTVCRRAERQLVALTRRERVGAETLPYLNRLSDALFVLARAANQSADELDRLWDSRA